MESQVNEMDGRTKRQLNPRFGWSGAAALINGYRLSITNA
jgi:hypothetical protein